MGEGGLARGHGVGLLAFGGAYRPLATAHPTPCGSERVLVVSTQWSGWVGGQAITQGVGNAPPQSLHRHPPPPLLRRRGGGGSVLGLHRSNRCGTGCEGMTEVWAMVRTVEGAEETRSHHGSLHGTIPLHPLPRPFRHPATTSAAPSCPLGTPSLHRGCTNRILTRGLWGP